MTDLISSDWKELDADNSQPSPNGVQGGYSPSQLAPIIRSIRGSLKRFYNQTNPVYTSTGAVNAYVLTFEAPLAAYSKGIIYRFWAHATNTGATTLNINSLGARAVVSRVDGSPLIAGAIVTGRMVEVVYNGNAFELLSVAFTPVQQGTGPNQGSAKISLGMSASNRLLMQAGNTDFGDTLPININGNATTLAGYAPSALPISTAVQTALNSAQTNTQTALNLKADLASPSFTGTPTAPTPPQGDNSTHLATTAYVDTGVQSAIVAAAPSGSVMMWAGNTAPAGYLLCNGTAVSRTTYAALFSVIGGIYGGGNGSTTFNLPDLRGVFVRGLDNGRGLDSGRALGSYQDSDNKSHNHGVNDPGHVHGGVQNGTASTGRSTSVDQPPAVYSFGNTWGATTGIWLSASGGAESRPRNVAMNYIIKT